MRSHVHPLSIASYHRLIEMGDLDGARVELLRGMLIEKMPKSPLHRRVTLQLYQEILNYAQSRQEAWLVMKEDPLTFIDSEPEPDISVVRGSLLDFDDHHPASAEWVIEVAISSTQIDLQKAEIYAEAGIPDYWLIRPEQKNLTVFREPKEGSYQSESLIPDSESVAPDVFPDFSVRLADYLP